MYSHCWSRRSTTCIQKFGEGCQVERFGWTRWWRKIWREMDGEDEWRVDDEVVVVGNRRCDACDLLWRVPSGDGFLVSGSQTRIHRFDSSRFFFGTQQFLRIYLRSSVLGDATARSPDGSKFIIYSDSFTAVTMFNSLRALPDYNCILKASVDFLLENNNDLRVLHVAGGDNGVADALYLTRALNLCLGLLVSSFGSYERIERPQLPILLRPPRGPLGAPGIWWHQLKSPGSQTGCHGHMRPSFESGLSWYNILSTNLLCDLTNQLSTRTTHSLRCIIYL